VTIIAVYTWPGLAIFLVVTIFVGLRKGWRGR
jgi:hypothetical protein